MYVGWPCLPSWSATSMGSTVSTSDASLVRVFFVSLVRRAALQNNLHGACVTKNDFPNKIVLSERCFIAEYTSIKVSE